LSIDLERDPVLLGRLYLVGGATYPLWWLLGPRGEPDPWWVWWMIGAAFALSGTRLMAWRRDPSFWLFLPSFAAALHLYTLYAQNPLAPFYAVAPLMNTVATLMALPRRSFQIAFSALVLPASVLPILYGGGAPSLFHFAAAVWLLVVSNRRFAKTHAAQQAAASEFRRVLGETEQQLVREKTDRLRLEEELQVAQRMESVGWLTGSFAHEFINHLMAIRVYAEILDQSLPAEPALRKDLQAIQDATEGAASLTARLLVVAQDAERESGPADLRRIVADNLEILGRVVGPSVSVASRLDQETCPVPVSASRAKQVLLNLAFNARDAMPEGGALTVDVTRCPADAVELPESVAGDELVRLAVTDTGTGIHPQARPHIFDPFFSTRADSRHSGLGLSIVYGIVRESHGHIRVESEPGKGTRFEIYWPLVSCGDTV
jgi:signal transduction histidine kinase